MRFLTNLAVLCAILKSTIAVEPGHNALGIGLSDSLEAAIHKDYGPVIFDGLAKTDCNAGECLLMPVRTTTCIIMTIELKSPPEDVFCCAPACKICPCLDCYPTDVIAYFQKWRLCEDQEKAKLFSKVYLGIANDKEKSRAEELGHTPNFIGVKT
ncbi:hypothetical protein PC9H_011817 [Pleurotus ostreatus]|uniref:Uncharacterized protein n=2 Tax=Pleurotus ostreatus TaxID=5322 RepID=A0A067NHL4_PLEO1|nr:uncharacterized protein PC9H_011817 [Pleurotus ostreatus]KAF7421295.1 hypothetical protein PC9H_011817 [Pleurotus ostreatus]KAJ8690845.1 hypothetical protein PTI98_012244 [Pleurotus ostreatus]KDQ23612.1 hypothetical protein PLEOSDRAFT_162376 [Pleurotus ostreatus PC15]